LGDAFDSVAGDLIRGLREGRESSDGGLTV